MTLTLPIEVDLTGTKYTTEDGRRVRIYAVDCGGDWCIHGAVWIEEEQRWVVGSWSINGGGLSGKRLIDAPPPKVVGWLNVYADRTSVVHASKRDADDGARNVKSAGLSRVACLRIEYTPGEGLHE